MWTIGAGNWIKYGWGLSMKEEWKPNMQLYMDLTNRPSAKDCPHPIVAAIAAVHAIAKKYPAPYTLMCSGGLDSQAMLYAWHLSGVPFNVVSIQYKSSGTFFNDYDLTELETLSKNLGVHIDYREFDLMSFLRDELPTVARFNDCDSPQICTFIRMSEMIRRGTILFGGNYIGPRAFVNYTLLGLHRYSLRVSSPKRTLIPFFLMHDPVLASSFESFSNGKSQPAEVYASAGFPLAIPVRKFNGFEKIKEFFDRYHDDIPGLYRLTYSGKPSARAFDLLFRHPYEGVGNSYRDKIEMKQILR